MYSGKPQIVSMRMPAELIERVDDAARRIGVTRSMLTRTALEVAVLTPDEWRARRSKEMSVIGLLRAGAGLDDDKPTKCRSPAKKGKK